MTQQTTTLSFVVLYSFIVPSFLEVPFVFSYTFIKTNIHSLAALSGRFTLVSLHSVVRACGRTIVIDRSDKRSDCTGVPNNVDGVFPYS